MLRAALLLAALSGAAALEVLKLTNQTYEAAILDNDYLLLEVCVRAAPPPLPSLPPTAARAPPPRA